MYNFDIYVISTVSLLKFIYIYWGRENIKHLMLTHHEYNNISFDNYYQEVLHELYVSIMFICPLFSYYCLFESNSQYSFSIFHTEDTSLVKKKFQSILPINMLSSLVIHNISISHLFVDDISKMKFQIHQCIFGEKFIQ